MCAKDRVAFDFPRTRIVSRLIEGKYPDTRRLWQRLIDEKERATVISRTGLRDAIARVHILAHREYHAVRLALAAGTLSISSSDADAQGATETVAVEYEGSRIEIDFNSQYLLDALDACDGAMIRLVLKDPGTAALITTDAEPGLLMIIMPMRV